MALQARPEPIAGLPCTGRNVRESPSHTGRRSRPYGHALSIPHHCAAHTKTTLSFQILEAALPPGIPAGRRSSSRSSVRLMPELATIGAIPAGSGRCAGGIVRSPSFFGNDRKTMPRIVFPAVGKTIGMQSEPRRPQIILLYIAGHVVKRAPKIAIPSCAPAGLHVDPRLFLLVSCPEIGA